MQIAVLLHKLIGFHQLQRIRRCRQHLTEQWVRIERNRRHQIIQLLRRHQRLCCRLLRAGGRHTRGLHTGGRRLNGVLLRIRLVLRWILLWILLGVLLRILRSLPEYGRSEGDDEQANGQNVQRPKAA